MLYGPRKVAHSMLFHACTFSPCKPSTHTAVAKTARSFATTMAAAVLAIRSRKRAEAEEEADMEKEFARTGVVQESKKDQAKRKYEEAQLEKEHKDPDVFVKNYGYISPHWFGGKFLPYQVNACRLYNTQAVTWSVAGVILFNFLAIIMEMEVDPVRRSQPPHGPRLRAMPDGCLRRAAVPLPRRR